MLSRVPLAALCLTAALCATAVGAASAGPLVRASHDPLGSHVRGATPAMNALIARGASRSASFRKLIEALNASDVVVYIEASKSMPAGLDGRLTFMTAAGGVRYLHVQVVSSLGFEELVSVAGHELQHALEVAAHPKVRDAASLANLYQLIGIPGPVQNRYDTVAARIMGKRVRAELS